MGLAGQVGVARVWSVEVPLGVVPPGATGPTKLRPAALAAAPPTVIVPPGAPWPPFQHQAAAETAVVAAAAAG